MIMKLWIATYVDHSETCDGKARILDVFKSKADAEMAVRNDIECWADEHAGRNIKVDFNKMSACFCDDADTGCEWSIEGRSLDVLENDEQANAVDYGQQQLEFDF